jgi:hypothetical protein
MSTLVIVLTAAMAVPGNGLEMVSGEIIQETQSLDLSGEWEGTWTTHATKTGKATLNAGDLRRHFGGGIILSEDFIAEEVGGGKLRINWGVAGPYLGIYRRMDDSIVISFRPAEEGYPTSYRTTSHGQYLLILHRVKPCK